MQTEFILAGILILISFAIILSSKMGMKSSSYIPVKIGDKTIYAELADTFKKQAMGLMGRKSMPGNHGMLFVFGNPGTYKFWMFNTSLPLDMIWMDSNKTIVYIQQNVQPCFILNCTSYGPNELSQYVLEVNANYTSANKISVGDKVEFSLS
jgi:uncharacterized membrane protein (UPF0127 family)